MSFPTDHPKNTICCEFVEPNNKKHFFYPSAKTIKGKEVIIHRFVVAELLNRVQLFATPWTAACKSSPSFTISLSLLKLTSIESVMSSNHHILCCPLLLLPSIFPSIRIFSNESALRIRWPKYWSFSFSISPSNEYSGLISFWTDWFACSPRVSQEASPTPQFKNINSSMLSLLYSPTLTSIHDYWKTIALTKTDLCLHSNVSAF